MARTSRRQRSLENEHLWLQGQVTVSCPKVKAASDCEDPCVQCSVKAAVLRYDGPKVYNIDHN